MVEKAEILIVDDVKANLVLFSGLLEGEDVSIVTASSGEEALALMPRHDFALALLDVMMPGMDGFVLASRIRDANPSEELPVIFITAVSTEAGNIFKGYQLGAVDYLVKPVEPDVLKGKVRVFVELHRQKAALRESTKALEETVARLSRSEAALQESEERYRIVAMQSGQIVYDYDPQSKTIGWWGNVHAMTGYGADEFQEGGIGLWKELIHPDDLRCAVEAREKARRDREDYSVHYRLRHKDGRTVYVEDNGSFLPNAQGEPSRMLGTMRDVTEQKEAQFTVARSNHFLQSILDGVPNPIYFKNANGEFELINDAGSDLFRRSKAEILGRSTKDFFTQETAGRKTHEDQRLLTDPEAEMLEYEDELPGPKGEIRTYQINKRLLRDAEGGRTGILVVLHDITDRKRDEEQIKYLAMHDPLTGLPNRILFMDRLTQVLSHSRRVKTKAALLFVDMDGLKELNDTKGHEAGDEALKVMAERVRECIREMDTAARLGGDEFVIVLQDVHACEDIDRVVARLTESFARPFNCAGDQCSLKASIGISVFPDDGDNVDTLLNKADIAMYSVKKKGGQGCAYFKE